MLTVTAPTTASQAHLTEITSLKNVSNESWGKSGFNICVFVHAYHILFVFLFFNLSYFVFQWCNWTHTGAKDRFCILFFCYSKILEQQPSSLQPPYFSTTLQLRFTLYFCLCLLLPVFLEILRLEFVLQIAIALLNNFLNKENFAIVSSFFWLVSLVFAL